MFVTNSRLTLIIDYIQSFIPRVVAGDPAAVAIYKKYFGTLKQSRVKTVQSKIVKTACVLFQHHSIVTLRRFF